MWIHVVGPILIQCVEYALGAVRTNYKAPVADFQGHSPKLLGAEVRRSAARRRSGSLGDRETAWVRCFSGYGNFFDRDDSAQFPKGRLRRRGEAGERKK